jgi:hypothetical protein
MKIRNKSLSSIKIPDGVKVTLFDQPSFKGRSIDLFTDNSCLISQDFLDRTSSLKITKYDERLFVSLYPECNFEGSEYQVGIGKYTVEQMGIPKNALSSLRVPPGLKVILYAGPSFNGRTYELNKDIACLINVGFDNQTNSIEVISDKEFASLEPEPTAAQEFTKGFSYVFFSYILPIFYMFLATAMGSLAANDAIGRSPGVRFVYFIYGSLFAPFILIYYIIRAFKGSYPLWYNFLPLTTYVSDNSLVRALLIPFTYKLDANAVYRLKQFDEFAKSYVPDFKPIKLPEIVNVQPITNNNVTAETNNTKPTNNNAAKPTNNNNVTATTEANNTKPVNNNAAKPTNNNNATATTETNNTKPVNNNAAKPTNNNNATATTEANNTKPTNNNAANPTNNTSATTETNNTKPVNNNAAKPTNNNNDAKPTNNNNATTAEINNTKPVNNNDAKPTNNTQTAPIQKPN